MNGCGQGKILGECLMTMEFKKNRFFCIFQIGNLYNPDFFIHDKKSLDFFLYKQNRNTLKAQNMKSNTLRCMMTNKKDFFLRI